MVHYEENVTVVIDTLKKYRYGTRAISISEKCYTQLKASIEDAGGVSFSVERAFNWCDTQIAKANRKPYRMAIYRLTDVYQYGRVMGTHLIIYPKLSPSNTELIDQYISSMPIGRYTSIHLKNIRHACTRFCCFAQYNGIDSVKKIDYPLLEQYDAFLRESNRAYYITEGLITGFLKYLADKGLCRIGYSLFVHYTESGKCTSFKDLTARARLLVESHREESLIFPASDFYQTIPHFKERFVSSGYSKTVTDYVPYHLTLLFLFLDREGLGYHRSIVEQWFVCVGEQLFGRGVYMARRTYEMYDDYTKEGDILPGHCWKHRENSFDQLPSWCREELEIFINGKKKEGWDKNTINMYCKCNVKFVSDE